MNQKKASITILIITTKTTNPLLKEERLTINQTNLLKSKNKNGDLQNTPPTSSLSNQTTTTAFNEEENKIQIFKNITNDITKIMSKIEATTIKTTTASTESTRNTHPFLKSSTNFKYYDPRERKQNRLSKDQNSANYNSLLKLFFLLLICSAGTTGNIFVISSIMIVDSFQMQGREF